MGTFTIKLRNLAVMMNTAACLCSCFSPLEGSPLTSQNGVEFSNPVIFLTQKNLNSDQQGKTQTQSASIARLLWETPAITDSLQYSVEVWEIVGDSPVSVSSPVVFGLSGDTQQGLEFDITRFDSGLHMIVVTFIPNQEKMYFAFIKQEDGQNCGAHASFVYSDLLDQRECGNHAGTGASNGAGTSSHL